MIVYNAAALPVLAIALAIAAGVQMVARTIASPWEAWVFASLGVPMFVTAVLWRRLRDETPRLYWTPLSAVGLGLTVIDVAWQVGSVGVAAACAGALLFAAFVVAAQQRADVVRTSRGRVLLERATALAADGRGPEVQEALARALLLPSRVRATPEVCERAARVLALYRELYERSLSHSERARIDALYNAVRRGYIGQAPGAPPFERAELEAVRAIMRRPRHDHTRHDGG